jgi:competence protein ComEC
MTLIYITLAWTIGIILARQVALPSPVLGGLTIVTFVVSLCYARAPKARLVAILATAALLGGWCYALAQPVIDAHHVAYYNDQGGVILRGWISAEPSVRATETQLELAVEDVELQGTHHPVKGKIVCTVPLYPKFEYGDQLLVKGKLETPTESADFSYKEYLAARGVHALVWRAQITRLEGLRGSVVLRWMLQRKNDLRKVIEAILPNPDAGLLNGILLGLGNTLPDYLAEAFRVTGLTHIIVISGFNISLVSQAAMLSSQRAFNRWLALWASLATIVLYMLFVGPSAPVVRATAMGGLFIGAQLVGRRSHALTSLAVASLVMTAANPLTLWSVSFQLSFAATVGLIVVEPVLARGVQTWVAGWAASDRALGWMAVLRDVLIVTVAAQIMTLPLIWYHFGQVSLISLLANALVLPVQPTIMALGAFATAVGTLWLSAGRVAAWLVWPFLRYCLLIIQWLGGADSAPSWAAFQIPRPSLAVVWAAYAFLGLGLALKRYKKLLTGVRSLLAQPRTLRIILPALVLVTLLIWVAALSLPDHKLHLYFLDVGQGDAILLRTPNGRFALVDGGPDPLLLTSRLGQIMPFWQRRIDLVISTHVDQDHLGGLIPVVERYQVGQVIESPVTDNSPLSAHWREILAARGIKSLPAARGMKVALDEGVSLDVLHPANGSPSTVGNEGNLNSVVVKVVMGQCRVLLTGDINTQVERDLLDAGQAVDATVLKVAHHGADTASSAEFLAAVNPQLAIISVGKDNRFGHPTEPVLKRLQARDCQVLRTDQNGTIELVSDGQTFWTKARGSK